MTPPNSSQLPWDLQCCHLRKKPWLSFYFEAVSIYFFAKIFLSSRYIADAPSAQSSNHRLRIDREQRWENTNRWTDRPSNGERITSGLILLKLHYWFLCGFLCILQRSFFLVPSKLLSKSFWSPAVLEIWTPSLFPTLFQWDGGEHSKSPSSPYIVIHKANPQSHPKSSADRSICLKLFRRNERETFFFWLWRR